MLEKILHRQVVNVRIKNDITKGLGKQMFYTLTKPPTPPPPPPTPQSRQSQMLGPQPNFLASIGNQFLQVWGSAIKIAWYN